MCGMHGDDLYPLGRTRRLDDLGTAQLNRRETGRRLHRRDRAARFGAVAGRLTTDVLDFLAEKKSHVADHDQRRILGSGNFSGG